MNAKIILLGSGVILCTAGAVTTHYLSQERLRLSRRLALVPQQRAALMMLTRAAEQRLVAAEAERTRLRTLLDRESATTGKSSPLSRLDSEISPPAPGAAAKQALPPRDWREQILKSPELQAMHFNSERPLIKQHFQPLLLALRLSPEQVARFEQAFISREEKIVDLMAIEQAQGPSVRTAVNVLKRRAGEEFDQDLQGVLGWDGYKKYYEYQRLTPARTLLKEVAGAAALAGETLSAAQAELLANIICETSTTYARGGPPDLGTIDWEIFDARARQVLTQAQFESLQKATARANARLEKAIADAKKADAARGKSSPPKA